MGRWLCVAGVVIVTMICWVFLSSSVEERTEKLEPLVSEKSSEPLRADALLSKHGDSRVEPIEDLKSLQAAITYFVLDNRHLNTIQLSTNEDLTQHLLSKSTNGAAELSDTHSILGENSGGEAVLLDRWEHPYIIHVRSAKVIELRSVGPDGEPYSPDDMVWPRESGFVE